MTNFAPTAQDYARHRAGFPERFFDQLEARGFGPGQTVVDLGSGTGTVALGLARRGAEVVAVDIAEPMLAQAAARARALHLCLQTVTGPAEDTGLPGGGYDLVTAGQCWHWFDRPRAAREVRRLLREHGTVVIAHLDWLRIHGGVVDESYRVMEAFGTSFPEHAEVGHSGIYPAWLDDLREAGFGALETFSFDVELEYSTADWRGRVRASSAVGGRLSPEEVERFDSLLAAALEAFDAPLSIPHRVWAVCGRRS